MRSKYQVNSLKQSNSKNNNTKILAFDSRYRSAVSIYFHVSIWLANYCGRWMLIGLVRSCHDTTPCAHAPNENVEQQTRQNKYCGACWYEWNLNANLHTGNQFFWIRSTLCKPYKHRWSLIIFIRFSTIWSNRLNRECECFSVYAVYALCHFVCFQKSCWHHGLWIWCALNLHNIDQQWAYNVTSRFAMKIKLFSTNESDRT